MILLQMQPLQNPHGVLENPSQMQPLQIPHGVLHAFYK
jgi:hypothetical protein